MKHTPLFNFENNWVKDTLNRYRIFNGTTIIPEKDEIPFTEEEAESVFSTLSKNGCNLIKWYLTWDTIEKEGPDCFNEEYLSYLRKIMKIAEKYNIYVIIAPLMHSWSKAIGGMGAPDYTLELAGFNKDKITEKYQQLYAASTMYTLFFAGNHLAPDILIQNSSAQDYLQTHFIQSMHHATRRIKECKAVIGFDVFSDPFFSFITLSDDQEFEYIKAASGYEAHFGKELNNQIVKKTGNNVFLDNHECIWKTVGVWKEIEGKPVLCKKNWFSKIGNNEIDYTRDFIKPFQQALIDDLTVKHDHYIFLQEKPQPASSFEWDEQIRPYPIAIAGMPIRLTREKKEHALFEFEWLSSNTCDEDNILTELFLPDSWFNQNPKIEANVNIKSTDYKKDEQKLYICSKSNAQCKIKITN